MDRHKRFREALKSMQKRRFAHFFEMSKTIDGVGQSLYIALRRADMVSTEIGKSEGWIMHLQNGMEAQDVSSRQAQELIKVAERNRSEYKRHLEAVLSGAQIAEAQAAVYITTLDTLRVKMLGYRLTGRQVAMSTDDFLYSITEAKLQLQAIDKTLEELELGPFPKTITVMPEQGN